MSGMLALLGLHLVQAPTLADNCLPLDDAVLRQHSSQIVSSSPGDEQNRNMALLKQYWQSRCLSDRAGASEAAVKSLARLLGSRRRRFHVARMLADVGPNLRYARRPLETALAAQIKLERRLARAAYPIVPSTGDVVSSSLRCVLEKARTGKLNASVCIFIGPLVPS
jgi:hypothetical protein